MGNDPGRYISDLPTAGESGESVSLVMQRDIFLQVTLHDTRLHKDALIKILVLKTCVDVFRRETSKRLTITVT
jgi:hypothetical protein